MLFSSGKKTKRDALKTQVDMSLATQPSKERIRKFQEFSEFVCANVPEMIDNMFVFMCRTSDTHTCRYLFKAKRIISFLGDIGYPYDISGIVKNTRYGDFYAHRNNFFSVLKAWVFINREQIKQKCEFENL